MDYKYTYMHLKGPVKSNSLLSTFSKNKIDLYSKYSSIKPLSKFTINFTEVH